MSVYNESDKGEWVYNHVYTLIKEIAKGPESYKKYSQDIVEKVLNELAKGGISIKVDFDDPVTSAYYTIVQSNSIDAEAKAVSRILMDFDELSEAGFKVSGNQQIFLYRLYELSCNRQVDAKSISASDFKKLTKYADWIGKLGTVANAVEWVGYAGNALSALADGNIKGATDELASCIGSSACGFISGQIAGALIAAFAVTNPLVAFATFAVLGLVGSAIGDEIAEGWKMIFDEIFGLYDDAGAYTYPVDPLIFDLNGDGVKTVAVADDVHFDFDQNGFAEKTGWISADDGLLVRDLNGNGNIDNGGELFGDLTAIAEGINAVNGFEALAAFDLNGDNVIDSNDDIYTELKIWQDKNQNGVVDEGELFSLQEAGIAGIGLDYTVMDERDENGNVHTQSGTYIKADGNTGTLEDVWLDRDLSDTVATDNLEETDEIRKLPDIQGKGNQYSLHQAMLRDETGTLQKLVEQYIEEKNSDSRKAMLPQIIYVWTGVADYDSAGRGSNLSDSRKLEALEVITGRDFNSSYGENPVYQAGQYIEQAFNKLVDLYFAQLESQTVYADLYSKLYQEMDVDENGNVILGTSGIVDYFMEMYSDEMVEGKRNILQFINNMKTRGVLEMVDCDKFYKELSFFCGDIEHAIDYFGNDVVTGTNGNDIIIGEMGNDVLSGKNGDDTYIFNLGDGEDVILEESGSDRIVFGEGIAAENIVVTRGDRDMYLTNKVSGDRIKVQDFFYNACYFVEEVEFADGTKWNLDDLKDKARYYYGTEEGDTISASNSYYWGPSREDNYVYAGAGDDTLYGEVGNDALYGGSGNDILYGGAGADALYGGSESDTYVFNLGDGEDVILEESGSDQIIFGEGIENLDLMFSKEGNHLKISLIGQDDSITISDYFYNDNYKVESFQTYDGSVLDYTKLNLIIQAMVSFEDTTGMMWEDAIEQKNEQANDIVNQWWTKEAI